MKVYQRQLIPKYYLREYPDDGFRRVELTNSQISNLRKRGASHVFYWQFQNIDAEYFEGYLIAKKSDMWYAQSIFSYDYGDAPSFSNFPSTYVSHRSKTLKFLRRTLKGDERSEFSIGVQYLIDWAERQFKMR